MTERWEPPPDMLRRTAAFIHDAPWIMCDPYVPKSTAARDRRQHEPCQKDFARARTLLRSIL